ncbi:ATP-binding protein [Paraflavitalea speifideaquila]|uniref:ATP-binding protein n=1 Tax=Paraflavitalea speifideaquila TaxID=3076558 RepID=UPI0028E52ADC|nr:ATP-binding protein [Paraflavitalea speifideiaquila]
MIHCTEEVPVAETEIPSLLLQPLVENAVKHGVASLGEKGLIRVDVLRQGDDMVIRISDNGLGFVAGTAVAGYGLKLTKDRIHLMNEMAGNEQLHLGIESVPQQGTIVRLLFKNWLA